MLLRHVLTKENVARLRRYGSGNGTVATDGSGTAVLDRKGRPVVLPFFQEEEVRQLQSLAFTWFTASGIQCCPERVPGQPFFLGLLGAFAAQTQDPDEEIVGLVRGGVPACVGESVPSTGIYRPRAQHEMAPSGDPLVVCEGNWKSARDAPETTLAEILADVSDGYASELKGGLEEARRRWGTRLAGGKLGLASGDRLTGDGTVSGLNGNCALPESHACPRVSDLDMCLRRARSRSAPSWQWMLVDFLCAHKQILLCEADRGLSLFHVDTPQGRRWFHYNTAFFGASFAQYYWGRVGGLIVRLVHVLLYTEHLALLYVDDLLIGLRHPGSEAQAQLVLAFLAIIGAPVSWRKFRLGRVLEWLGFHLDFRAEWQVALTEAKKEKILSSLTPLTAVGVKVLRRDLESLVGLLMWFTSIAPFHRPFLSEF